MSVLAALLKALVLPPMSLFVLALAGWSVRRRLPRVARALWLASLTLLVLMSMPFVGRGLVHSLQGDEALDPPGLAPPAGAIVVLSAGLYRAAPEFGEDVVDDDTLERLRYAAWLHRKTGGVPLLTTGGRLEGEDRPLAGIMARALEEDFDVPVRWVDNLARDPSGGRRSHGTFGNALGTAELLFAEEITRVYLVTSAWHMPRARASFEAVGFDVVPAPTGFAPPMRFGPEAFVPTAQALAETSAGLHEWLARVWYRLALY
ncbi:MAG: YdcF family protein [Acidobacteriota bacterium]|nr:YdcF family protein [Acidobacteriota bacterium]